MSNLDMINSKGKVSKLLSKSRIIVREKGICYFLQAGTNKIKRRFSPSVNLWYFKLFKSRKLFILQGKKYRYFYHKYNMTWRNERAVEVSVIWNIIKEHHGSILEVGNVLAHYFAFQHDVVDKYEKAEGVINKDVVGLCLKNKYDLIVSISTIEHIGWDEDPLDKNQKLNVRNKPLQAIESLKRLLNPNGTLILTFPVGSNPNLDALVKSGEIAFTKTLCMKRISKDNRWVETEWKEVENLQYDKPFPFANGLVIGIIN